MTATSTPTSLDEAPPTREDGLSIPKHLWAAPVAAGRRCERPPRLSRLILLLPVAALISAYLAAAAAAHGYVQAGGWLLGVAVIAILAGCVVLGIHTHRIARYRTEAPR